MNKKELLKAIEDLQSFQLSNEKEGYTSLEYSDSLDLYIAYLYTEESGCYSNQGKLISSYTKVELYDVFKEKNQEEIDNLKITFLKVE